MSQQQIIKLTVAEREKLEQLLRGGESAVRQQTRVRILLHSDRSQGKWRTDQEVSEAVHCSKGTVVNVRRRFLAEGLEAAITERLRPGAKRKLTGEIEAHLIALACSPAPEGRSQWTLRLLAERLIELEYLPYISHVSVGEQLKKTNLSLG